MTLPQHHKEHFKNCGHTGDEFHPPVPDPPNTPTEHPGGEVVADKKRGTVVNANFGDGPVVTFLLDGGHEVAGADGPEIKFSVQNPSTGKGEDLGYREPSGPDADTGRTFWSL